MKSFFSVLLASFAFALALVPNMDLCCELEKIPELVDHYRGHKLSDGDSFYQFVEGHYLHQDGEDHDHTESSHEELPFHSSHQCSHVSSCFTTINTLIVSEFKLFGHADCTEYQFTFSLAFLEAPFQPPQV